MSGANSPSGVVAGHLSGLMGAASAPVPGMIAPPGRLDPPVGARTALGPHHHPGRRHFGALLDVPRRAGRRRVELAGRGMAEVIRTRGLPSSLYADRGSHYWLTPEAGGKVDRTRPAQPGLAMRPLGVEMIPACSPEARGRCERMFATDQERPPKELAARGIDTMQHASRYLAEQPPARRSTRSSRPPRPRPAVPSCRASARNWPTCGANTTNERSPETTA